MRTGRSRSVAGVDGVTDCSVALRAKMGSFRPRTTPGSAPLQWPRCRIGSYDAMTQSTRKLLGTVLILGSLLVWSVLGMWIYMSFLGAAVWWLLIGFFA